MCTCSNPAVSDGGGSRGGNPVITGTIVDPEGIPVSNVFVQLIKADYNPLTHPSLKPSSVFITDSTGIYYLETSASGRYTIEAKGISNGNRLIKFDIIALKDSICTLSADTLRAPGVLRVILPEKAINSKGILFVPGTSICKRLTDTAGIITIDSVPSATLPVLYYATENSTERKVIQYTIKVEPSETTLVGDISSVQYRQIVLNTSASGASVNSNLYGFPVLIRLNSTNFDFTQANPDGSNLYFTNKNDKFLPFEIARWNTTGKTAEIWVKVDTIYGNDSTQSINMFWGKTDSPSFSNSGAVFDTAAGFDGMWHLEENGNEPALDATSNHFDGIAYHMPVSSVNGAVGNARLFNGDSSFIIMPGTRSGKLNYPENGDYTVSAWVYADTIDQNHHTIVAKGFKQYFLQLSFLPASLAKWEFSTFSQEKHWRMSNFQAKEKMWVLLTGVRQGDLQYLFCNGELVSSTITEYTHTVDNLDRDTTDDLTIGRFMTEATFPINFGYCYFKGMIDEVQISSVARNADWVKLCYMNQRRDDRLVKFK